MRVVFFVAVFALAVCSAKDLSRGFNSDIAWTDLETGLAEGKASNKPIVVLVHKSWCGACTRLKAEVAGSKELAGLSDKFVMVNAEDDEAPHGDAEWEMDGGYIPRVIFVEPNGKIRSDLINEGGNPKYKYYYTDAAAIMRAMNTALEKIEIVAETASSDASSMSDRPSDLPAIEEEEPYVDDDDDDDEALKAEL